MSVRRWMSLMFGGTTIYWMKHDDGKVALHVCTAVKKEGQRQKAAERVESVASEMAESVGCKVQRHGSFMKWDGRGGAMAIGVAEMPWSPRVESELSRMGLAEVR